MSPVECDDSIKELIKKSETQRAKYDKGIYETLEQLLNEGIKRHDSGLISYACYYLAEAHFNLNGSVEKMDKYLTMGLKAQQKQLDVSITARFYNLLGVLEKLRGNPILSADYYMTALHFANHPDADSHISGIVNLNFANLLYELGDYKGCCRSAEKALPSVLSQKKDGRYYSNAFESYVILCSGYMELGEGYGELIDRYIIEAERLSKGLQGEVRKLAEIELCGIRIGRFHAMGLEDRLKKEISSVLEMIREIGSVPDMGSDIHRIGKMLLRIGRVEDCGKVLKELKSWEINRELSGVRTQVLDLEIEYSDIVGEIAERDRAAYRQYKLKRGSGEEYLSAIRIRRELEKLHIRNEEIEAENERLARMADCDELTGLFNRSHLNRFSEDAFERAYRNRQYIAFEMLDIDNFKQYNDRYGHRAGDECLIAVGREIKRLCDENEGIYAARYGGDEFVIIYENMDDETILSHANRLRSSIGEIRLKTAGDAAISVSQGIRNAVPSKKNRLWDFTFAADSALYQVKRKKRGEIRIVHRTRLTEELPT